MFLILLVSTIENHNQCKQGRYIEGEIQTLGLQLITENCASHVQGDSSLVLDLVFLNCNLSEHTVEIGQCLFDHILVWISCPLVPVTSHKNPSVCYFRLFKG